jgi:hypothetical protein
MRTALNTSDLRNRQAIGSGAWIRSRPACPSDTPVGPCRIVSIRPTGVTRRSIREHFQIEFTQKKSSATA